MLHMGAATIDTDTRLCPPAQWKAGLLSFLTVYDTPMLQTYRRVYRRVIYR